MKTKQLLLSVIALTAFILSACGGATPIPDAMMEKPTEVAMEDTMAEPTHETMQDETPMADSDTMMESPTWYSVSLTDARSGQTFSIESLKGKVILVETMAVWCSNCYSQQLEVQKLHGQLGERDDFVSIGLDIDSNEDAGKLKGFVESKGFDWLYAVSPADVSREIAALYGDQFLNPPSTPIIVIDRHGAAHVTPFGIKSVEELLQYIQPFLDEGM